ncbi:MAG: hypothetical protein LBL79_03675 [Prevotella sp.]|jgi:hypothetical protein|nr:hypothetical protein [Prevotella sp.]
MKKILFTAFCSLMIIAAGTSCGSKNKTDGTKNVENTTGAKPAKDKYVKLAAKMNAGMPQVFPGGIRVDRVEAVSDKEFRYVLTWTKEPAISAEEFVRSTKLPLSMGIREGKEELETLRKDKMTISYAYYKMDGSLFAEIKITPEEYSK